MELFLIFTKRKKVAWLMPKKASWPITASVSSKWTKSKIMVMFWWRLSNMTSVSSSTKIRSNNYKKLNTTTNLPRPISTADKLMKPGIMPLSPCLNMKSKSKTKHGLTSKDALKSSQYTKITSRSFYKKKILLTPKRPSISKSNSSIKIKTVF